MNQLLSLMSLAWLHLIAYPVGSSLVEVPQNPLLTLELDSYYEAGGHVRTPDASLEV